MIVQVAFHRLEVFEGPGAADFPIEDFVVAQFPDDGFVHQELDVFDVVEGFDAGGAFLGAPPVAGFARIYTFDDA